MVSQAVGLLPALDWLHWQRADLVALAKREQEHVVYVQGVGKEAVLW